MDPKGQNNPYMGYARAWLVESVSSPRTLWTTATWPEHRPAGRHKWISLYLDRTQMGFHTQRTGDQGSCQCFWQPEDDGGYRQTHRSDNYDGPPTKYIFWWAC